MAGKVESRLRELGVELPVAPPAVGAYAPATAVGNLLLTSGQLPFVAGALCAVGKVGGEVSEQSAYDAARVCAINGLAQLKSLVEDLDRIQRIIRVEGYVHAAPAFQRHANVVNGASELLNELYGASGSHVRVAIGVNEMPLGAAVQIALWAERA